MMEPMRINVILEGKSKVGKDWIINNGDGHYIDKIFHLWQDAPLFMAKSVQTRECRVVASDKDKHFVVKFL